MRLTALAVAAALLGCSSAGASAQLGTPPSTALDRARASFAEGDRAAAIKILRSALASDPRDAAVHNMLGAIFNREGNYREALVHAMEAVRLKPEEPRYRYNRAIVLSERGRFEEAVLDFDHAIGETPGQAPMYLERGAALLSLGRAEAARSDWASARRLEPKLAWIDWYEGLHDLLDGRHEQAIASIRRVAEQQPDFANAQAWLVLAHTLAGLPFRPNQVEDPWVRKLLEFHAGGIGGDELVTVANADASTGDRRRVGEAWLHRGVKLNASNPQEARAAFARAARVNAPRHMWKLLAERLSAR